MLTNRTTGDAGLLELDTWTTRSSRRMMALDQMVTNRYQLDEVNQGYRDMLDGRNIRGLLIHEPSPSRSRSGNRADRIGRRRPLDRQHAEPPACPPVPWADSMLSGLNRRGRRMVRGMLLWINGPFGGGKTHTAHEIQRRLAGSVVCDPEHLGLGLHRMMPRQLRGNFQDIPAWRQGACQVLDLVLGHHDGDVIVPMTVIEPAYLTEILGPLRANGHQVRHYSLLAARGTVLRRLRGRTLPLQRDVFAEAMLDQCLDRLSHDDFAEHVRTDELTIAQVADRIAASAGLTLTPDGHSFLRARARRTWVTIRHIRIVLPGRLTSPA